MPEKTAMRPGAAIMQSLWVDTARLPEFPRLHGDARTEALVIGGGLCGVLCAYFLEKAGVPCLLVEAGRIGSGTSGSTTAKITSQHGLIYARLLKRLGPERAGMYLAANENALAQYRALCGEVPCGFAEREAVIYTRRSPAKIEAEAEAVNRLGFPAQYRGALPLPFLTAGGVVFPGQAQFHPLQFLAHIARGLRICEHTPVRRLEGRTAYTDHGRIEARRVIVATHFPFWNRHGAYFMKLYQERAYVLALAGAPELPGMYLDEAQNGFSLRSHQGLLILGGSGARTGKPGRAWAPLQEFAAQQFPAAQATHAWAAQDCMPLDDIPYVGPYARATPDVFVATGFHKWGMTSAMAAALLLADLVQGRPNDYAALFCPDRPMRKAQLLVNAGEAILNLCTPTAPRCPHMGCALKWNPAEHSWDCPCHGSRFTHDGDCLESPAVKGMRRDGER